MHRIAVLGFTPIATRAATAVSGASSAWVVLGVPIITGLFALGLYVLKDYLEGRRHRNPTDTQKLIRTLEHDVKAGALREADLAARLEAVSAQLDVALADLRGQRREGS